MLALPGAAYLYQGEELGLPEDTTDCPTRSARTRPSFRTRAATEAGRDGCRVPLPWGRTRPSFGFGPTGRSWLPQPAIFGEYAVDLQDGVPGSTLELYRGAAARPARARARHGRPRDSTAADDVVALVNTGRDRRVRVLANLGADPVAPAGGRRACWWPRAT